MLKPFYLNLITTIFIGTLLTSCTSKKENFDIDLTNFKVPDKSKVKNSKPDWEIPSLSEKLKIRDKLSTYKNNSEVLNSIIFGKKDPFSENKTFINKLNSQFKLTGFLNTKNEQYAFVNYLENEGTISINSIGGVNTNLLPYGAKVIKIDPKNMKLTINYANKNFIFEL